MNARPMIRLGILAVLLLGATAPAEAQLGGLKKRLQERVERTVEKRVEQHTRPRAPVYNEHVLVMTPEVLDRFALALAAEEAKRGEAGGEPGEGPGQAALRTGGFTRTQYAILKERITPFCAASASAGVGGDVRVPGADNQFFVYNRAEVEALRPRCEHLGGLLQAVL